MLALIKKIMNIKKLLIFSSILLIIACNQGLKQETEVKKKNKPNIKRIEVDLKIERFEQDIMNVNLSDISSRLIFMSLLSL